MLAKDPRNTVIPNDGVAEVGEPQTDQAWRVLRYELESFVCEGQYHKGLENILRGYLENLSRDTQPAIWVSGFYGSGKSHLVRVLEHLWRDTTFPDGTSARSLVNLPADIRELLQELTTAGRREGGLWAASGKLGAGAKGSVNLAVLGILFRSSGLPTKYPQGRFCLWLEQQGALKSFVEKVESAGKTFTSEINHFYQSNVIAEALLALFPDFAPDAHQARAILRAQYPHVDDINEEELLYVMDEILRLHAGGDRALPCTLLVFDELQQYIGDDSEKTLKVQFLVEACSKRFSNKLLFIATGQSAIQGRCS